jgi:hypothetical protein
MRRLSCTAQPRGVRGEGGGGMVWRARDASARLVLVFRLFLGFFLFCLFPFGISGFFLFLIVYVHI